jgi:membrane protein implicated in regulation of membrane protease activity
MLETGLGGLIEAEALDEEEKMLGLQAFSASIYQLGGLQDWKVLMALFAVSTIAPRATKRAVKRREEKAQQSASKVESELKATLVEVKEKAA